MKDFQDKVAVITGGASGIGLGLAKHALGLGMKVVIADVERSALDRAVAELGQGEDQLLAVEVDVADPDQVQAMADKTQQAFGGVQLLFNNAGVASNKPVWETSAADWNWVLGVNLLGVTNGLRAFTPMMIAQGEGHIVNTASIAGMISARGTGAYTVSKHAVVALTELLAGDLQQAGAEQVGASVLCPSFVKTQVYASRRNRPQSLTAEKSAEDLAEEQMIEEVSAEIFVTSLSTEAVAEQVFQAVRDEQFYIFTHPEGSRQVIEQRMKTILEGQSDPAMGPEYFPL